eukprot:TRINITY_DN159_c0_g4_i1.p1 TRINITY_DN159_c0_g4~~TRINITY_DN159_c0_g4_i1.p1  ORF type:complete len:658 (-),score=153.36 TRINITY_DN159_c0_g4_i1:242-2215(-)
MTGYPDLPSRYGTTWGERQQEECIHNSWGGEGDPSSKINWNYHCFPDGSSCSSVSVPVQVGRKRKASDHSPATNYSLMEAREVDNNIISTQLNSAPPVQPVIPEYATVLTPQYGYSSQYSQAYVAKDYPCSEWNIDDYQPWDNNIWSHININDSYVNQNQSQHSFVIEKSKNQKQHQNVLERQVTVVPYQQQQQQVTVVSHHHHQQQQQQSQMQTCHDVERLIPYQQQSIQNQQQIRNQQVQQKIAIQETQQERKTEQPQHQIPTISLKHSEDRAENQTDKLQEVQRQHHQNLLTLSLYDFNNSPLHSPSDFTLESDDDLGVEFQKSREGESKQQQQTLGSLVISRNLWMDDLQQETSVSLWNLQTLELVQFNGFFRKKLECKRKEMSAFTLQSMFRSENPDVVRSKRLLETLQSLFQVGSIDLTTTNSAFISKSGTIKHQSGVIRLLKAQGKALLLSIQRITRVELPSPSSSSSSSSTSSPSFSSSHQSPTSSGNSPSPVVTQISSSQYPSSLMNSQNQKPKSYLNLPTYLYPSASTLTQSFPAFAHTPPTLGATHLQTASPLSTLEETFSRYPQVNDYLQRVSSQLSNSNAHEELDEDQIALAMRRAKKLCRPNALKKVSKFCAADLRFRFYEGPNAKRKNKKAGAQPNLPSDPI